MIHAIHPETGHIHWKCLGKGGQCQKPNTVHVTHTAITWLEPALVALPPCACGARCFVKVEFTEEELQAENMQEYGMVPKEMTVPHAITGEPVPVLIPALMPIGPNPAIARHQAFKALLEQHGRGYVLPEEGQQREEAGDEPSAAAN